MDMAKKLSKLVELEIDCFGKNKDGGRVFDIARKVNVMIARSNGFTTNDCEFYNSMTSKCNASDSEEQGFCYLQMERIGLQVSSVKVLGCFGRDNNDRRVFEDAEQIVAIKFSGGLHIPLCMFYQNGTGECTSSYEKEKWGDCYNVSEPPLEK